MIHQIIGYLRRQHIIRYGGFKGLAIKGSIMYWLMLEE